MMTKSHKLRSFATSVIGASHVRKGIPCQDYSLAFDDPTTGLHVAIVSDGHGGSTYVRSDRGSEIAVSVAKRVILAFVDDPKAHSLFAGRAGRVTTIASDMPDTLIPLHNPAAGIPDQEKTQAQLDEERQNSDYHSQIEGNEDIEDVMRMLFGRISTMWRQEISDDAAAHPFNPEEKALLGNNRLEKAYGATLMAFVVTPRYWFAFQLGDGKMVAYQPDATWTEPVPWDHKCFLNLTTSLCQSDCVARFRYAYNGKGELPIAVFLGSDGLDDTWQTMELLEESYLAVLRNIADDGIESTKKELTDNVLRQWSERGSTDDMSVAAVIDLSATDMMRDIWDEQRKVKTRRNDLFETQGILHENTDRLAEAREKLKQTAEQMCALQAAEKQLQQEIERLETEKKKLQQEIEQHSKEIKAKATDLAARIATLEPEPLEPATPPADKFISDHYSSYCKICTRCVHRTPPPFRPKAESQQ